MTTKTVTLTLTVDELNKVLDSLAAKASEIRAMMRLYDNNYEVVKALCDSASAYDKVNDTIRRAMSKQPVR